MNQSFIDDIAKYVIKYASRYDIKVHSPIIAQAILESENGSSDLAIHANNFFNLKYKRGRCHTETGIYYKINKDASSDITKWCKFDCLEDSVIGYFDYINISKYSKLKNIDDPNIYLNNIKKAGYNKSEEYVDTLIHIINEYNLTQYDKIHEQESKKYYHCQCGCYTDKDNVNILVNCLKLHGFDSIVEKKNNKYYVQAGVYKIKSFAKKKAESLKSEGFNVCIRYY